MAVAKACVGHLSPALCYPGLVEQSHGKWDAQCLPMKTLIRLRSDPSWKEAFPFSGPDPQCIFAFPCLGKFDLPPEGMLAVGNK